MMTTHWVAAHTLALLAGHHNHAATVYLRHHAFGPFCRVLRSLERHHTHKAIRELRAIVRSLKGGF